MHEFPIDWKFKEKNDCNRLTLNNEWTLVCVWSQHSPLKPEYLEIRRNSTAKKFLVSGTVEIRYNGILLRQRKFLQLIEYGFDTTTIKLDCHMNHNHNLFAPYDPNPNDSIFYHGNKKYWINGTIKITAYERDNECAEGVQFNSLFDLSNDFERLLDPKATYFSDVTVNCGSVSFSAHKSILSARSNVFAAMFANQMKENVDNKVNIVDLSPQVLKTMLTYIYSGKTGDLSVESAGELLFAADKYRLQDLKRVCRDHLKSCLSTENVLRTLVLGYLHDEDLKVSAMEFICNKCEDFEVLEKTVEWTNLREKTPSLAMDVLTGLVKSKDRKLKLKK